MRSQKVIIIGAGFAGLTTAALLAKEGFKVTVLEKNHEPGGRAITYREKGFVFDMGPSWYLMPEAFEHYFKFFNKTPRDYFKLVKLDPSYRVYYGKNDHYDISSELKDNRKNFNRIQKNGYQQMLRYLDLAGYQYKVAVKNFLYRDYNSIFDFFNKQVVLEGTKLNIFKSVDSLGTKFSLLDKLKKITGYTMVFIGGSPKMTPAFYSLMTHIDLNLGVWYPMQGMWKIADALYKLGQEQGVEYRFKHEVKKILVDKKTANKVKTNKGTFPADIIISNADYVHTEMDLLEKRSRCYSAGYWHNKVIAPAAIIIYLGIKKKLKNIRHHNLYFHDNWDEHFDTIFKNPSWPDKFSYYVSCPSKTDKSVAPRGCENLFFLVPAAAGLKDTDKLREKLADKAIRHFEDLIGQSFKKAIKVKRIFSQRDFIKEYHSYKGSAFSLAHTLFQTAVFRPARKSRKVRNLYFTGQYTHPGVGVPMTFIAGELTAKRIIKDYDR